MATPAQRTEALAHAEEMMGKFRDIVRKLDLPVTCIDQVADIYLGRLDAVVTQEHYAVQARIADKVKKLTGLRLDNDPAEVAKARRQLGGRGVIGGMGDYLGVGGLGGEVIDTELYNLSETELDEQIAKLSTNG